jgi:hypothetical protein
MLHGKSTGTVHTVNPQNVQLQNVQDTKRLVTERPGCKTSRIQNVQDTKPPVTKRPVTECPGQDTKRPGQKTSSFCKL